MIKDGRKVLFSFVEKFENVSATISDADLLILGKKYIEELANGGEFTNDQMQAGTQVVCSSSVSTLINCTKLPNDKPMYNEIKQFYYKIMSTTNNEFYMEIKNKDFINALRKNEKFQKSEEYKEFIKSEKK